ncbi:MAG: hypothetical protein OK438_03395 [Thaumarchaeota archaeon]|nr:hypothetical protein [Nitrososphaerota archaeon]
MRLGWGGGVIVSILVAAAAFFFGLVNGTYAVSYALLFVGVWTIISAFFFVDIKDRHYYAGWGVVMAALSTFAYLYYTYTIGLLLVAMVILILLYIYAGRTAKNVTAAMSPTSSPGGTPATKPS